MTSFRSHKLQHLPHEDWQISYDVIILLPIKLWIDNWKYESKYYCIDVRCVYDVTDLWQVWPVLSTLREAHVRKFILKLYWATLMAESRDIGDTSQPVHQSEALWANTHNELRHIKNLQQYMYSKWNVASAPNMLLCHRMQHSDYLCFRRGRHHSLLDIIYTI